MTIKKAFTPIMSLLQANLAMSVEEILPQVIELASAKAAGGASSVFHKDETGNTLAIRCYYHKLWMNPEVVEFGSKASSATGLNSMCKDGTSKWTKQQRDAKKAKEQLLVDLASGEIEASDLPQLLDEIEQDQAVIIPLPEGTPAFETLEELLASL